MSAAGLLAPLLCYCCCFAGIFSVCCRCCKVDYVAAVLLLRSGYCCCCAIVVAAGLLLLPFIMCLTHVEDERACRCLQWLITSQASPRWRSGDHYLGCFTRSSTTSAASNLCCV